MQLVINTFGATLRKEGDRFVITAGSKKLGVFAHKTIRYRLSVVRADRDSVEGTS
jgi:hypothetical protein